MQGNSTDIQEHKLPAGIHLRTMKNPSLPTKTHRFQSYPQLESVYLSYS